MLFSILNILFIHILEFILFMKGSIRVMTRCDNSWNDAQIRACPKSDFQNALFVINFWFDKIKIITVCAPIKPIKPIR